jgi:site-specific recombinase XerD
MSVHKLKDGRWFVHYRIPKSENKYKREYFGRGPGAEHAARERDKSLAASRRIRRLSGHIASPTFLELAEAYLAGRMASMESTTYSVLKYKLTAFILPELSHIPAMQLTKERIDSYVQNRLAKGRRPGTIHREITDIQAILNFAVSRGAIPHNPLTGYKKPRPDPNIITPPTLKEMKKINSCAPDHLQRALKLIFYTGARPGREILNLKWESVNFAQNTIRIISAKKHGLKFRDVPIFKSFRAELETWHKEDKAAAKKAEGKPDMYSHIVNYKGRGVKSLQTSWRHAKEKAKIERDIIPYSYRHAFVSMLLDSGADLKSVSEIVGHSSPTLTLKVYQHTNRLMHRAAIEKLPAVNW